MQECLLCATPTHLLLLGLGHDVWLRLLHEFGVGQPAAEPRQFLLQLGLLLAQPFRLLLRVEQACAIEETERISDGPEGGQTLHGLWQHEGMTPILW